VVHVVYDGQVLVIDYFCVIFVGVVLPPCRRGDPTCRHGHCTGDLTLCGDGMGSGTSAVVPVTKDGG
jgi:hypothetical protein